MDPRSYLRTMFPQWLAGLGVTLLLLQLGFVVGWSSPMMARLTAPDSPIPVSPEQASWVASLVNLGRLIGGVTGAVALNYLGSKQSILATLLPLLLGWLTLALANHVYWLYVARLCSGIGMGMAYSTFPLYIGEVSLPEIRGTLISLASVGGTFGQLLCSVGNVYLDLKISSCIYLAICLLIMGMFFWLPESPHHLVKIGKTEDALSSIRWYRAGKEVEKELEAVEKFVTTSGDKTFCQKLQELKAPSLRRATFHIIALYTFMQISGLNSIMFYMETILQHGKVTIMAPSSVVIYVNICGIFSAALSTQLIDRYGRKFLLLTSSIGVSICIITLMVYFFLLDSGVKTPNLELLPVCSMFIFVISFWIGLFPVPSTVLSETFPANIKFIAASIASLTGAIMAFVSSKTYQPLVDLLGEAYVFLIYAVCSAVVIPYVIFAMKETKGKSLQQIQDERMDTSSKAGGA